MNASKHGNIFRLYAFGLVIIVWLANFDVLFSIGIHGQVTDETGVPLPDAKVVVGGRKRPVEISRNSGQFCIVLPPGTYSVIGGSNF